MIQRLPRPIKNRYAIDGYCNEILVTSASEGSARIDPCYNGESFSKAVFMQKHRFVLAFFSSLFFVVFFAGCENKPAPDPNKGKIVLEQVCARCHNLDIPPKTFEGEKAPPMMAVVFHLKDFMKVSDPSAKREKFIEFVTDYALHPDAKKSYCDKESLKSYGVMPSLKGQVTAAQLRDAAAYMYERYDKKRYLERMEAKARLDAMPLYRQVLETKNCLGCHGIDKPRLGPSFADIAEKYAGRGPEPIMEAIRNGSRGKWPGFKVPMPPFKDLTQKQLEAVAEWILERK